VRGYRGAGRRPHFLVNGGADNNALVLDDHQAEALKSTERGYAMTREAAMSALMQAVAADRQPHDDELFAQAHHHQLLRTFN
jgi:hypothetical protein